MQDQPSAKELMEAVAQFLRDHAARQLDHHAAFHARVAANAIDIVGRELEFGRAAEKSELQRLIALLGHPGDLADLNHELSERIASGELTLASPGLSEHLWDTTLDKLKMDQPNYKSYLRERDGV